MKTFTTFISEETAKEKAHKLGLKYNGFGYWKDSRTGKNTHKSKGDELVPIHPEEIATEDPRKKEEPTDDKGLKPTDTTTPRINTSELGTMVGSPPVPEDDDEWIPGPEGDNCVSDGAKPEEIAADSFVGKTNDMNWTAGPEGSNYKTDSFDKLTAKILTPKTDVHKRVMEELTLMLESDEPASKQIRDLRSKNTKPEAGDKTRAARDHLKKLDTKARNKVIDDVNVSVNRPVRKMTKQRDTAGDTKRDEFGFTKHKRVKRDPSENTKKEKLGFEKNVGIEDKAEKVKSKLKDEEKVSELNALARRLASDPDYDMSDNNVGEFIGRGSFGSVYDSKDGKTVIKKGQIGVDELRALYKMRDNPNFPSLISAVFDSPFAHQSSVENNPTGSRPRKGTNYWNPEDYGEEGNREFDRKFPMARGTFAMTKAKGIPLQDALYDAGPEVKEKLKQNYWKARAALHRQGIAHNDMAHRNVFADPETGEVNILDFGLSKKDPRAALFAALGGMVPDRSEGESNWLRDADIPSDFRHVDDMDEDHPVYQNINKVSEYLANKGINMDEEDVLNALSGGTRLTDGDIERFSDALGIRGTDDEVEEQAYELINMLYDGIDGVNPKQKELENRMSSAFTKRSKESQTVDTANRIRANKGRPPIQTRKVVPKNNLDYDD